MRVSFFVAILLLGLGSCGQGPAATGKTFVSPPTPGGRLCMASCREAKDYCAQGCDFEQRRCTNEMQAQAIKDYETYARDQFAARQPTDLRPRDFERPERCQPVSCRQKCDETYQSCFETCGGKVTETSSCKAFCF